MAIQYSTTHRTNAIADVSTQVGASGVLKIFTGSPPANCGTADTGTLLSSHTCNASSFGSTTNGVLTANSIGSAVAGNTGTAGYFRVYPSSPTTTNAVMQGLCGTSGSDLNLATTSISSGVTVTISNFVLTAYGA